MRKKLVSLFMCGILLVGICSLVGCGDSGDKLKEENDAWFEKASQNQHELDDLEKKLK
ncbi:MAG: hypothetical protein ACLTDM_20970 [Clostridium butyricum]